MNRGRINLIGRLQLVMEPNIEAEHEDIIALRVLRIQEGIVKVKHYIFRFIDHVL